ncbi:MAG: ABC transporter substrate-binding protein [Nitrospiraceae bacterium]|nr:ABC transporter substrate-binding protein [Nitrospiraceae bacterium]
MSFPSFFQRTVVVFSMAILLSGCSRGSVASLHLAPRNPVTGGHLSMDILSDPKTFNPALASETSSTQILGYLFRGLTRESPEDGSVKPDLAEKWRISDGGRRVTFFLSRNLKWSDGAPLDGRDVLFTYRDVYNNPKVATPIRGLLTVAGKPIQVSLKDDYTVVFETSVPFAPLLEELGAEILPRHILAPAISSGKFNQAWSIRENPRNIVGDGPFMMTRYVPGQIVSLAVNPHYTPPPGLEPSPGCPLPCLSSIDLRIVGDANSQLVRFLAGKGDLYGVSPNEMSLLKPAAKRAAFTLFTRGPGLSESFLTFNQNPRSPIAAYKRAWFVSRKFREAIAWSIDRKAMISIVLNGMGEPIYGPVSPSVRAFYHQTYPIYRHDPQKARDLLIKAGFHLERGRLFDASGHAVEIVLLTNVESPQRMLMAQIIQSNLLDVGIKVRVVGLQFNMLATNVMTSFNWEMLLFGLTGVTDPHGDAAVWKSSGFLHLWNPREKKPQEPWEAEIDSLFEQGSLEMNPAKRKKIYDKWQEIAHHELPMVDLVTPDGITAVRKTLGGIRPSPLGGVVPHITQVFQKARIVHS